MAPASNSAGKIFGVTLIIEDVTYSKESEDLIVKQNDDLRKANQELDKFVYSVSHDLRSPIANVMGLTTIIDACEKLEEVQEYSAMIERTMHRMDDFIHNILDYSRNNRLEVNSEELDLHELVEELILDHYHIEGMKSIDFKNLVAKGFIMNSDGQRIRIILGNLLSNAIKYHDPKKEAPTIEIEAERKDQTVELKVRDNGQGIDQAHLPKLFEMFYTANIRAEGSGIGLYILQDAVHLLGGKVEVNSELGQGTEFIILLPEREEI
ncbi:MAG: HAMP domain-containing sensor histidine kinase [Owenweeksia sp.]|nr:HAMP domain-containing sensor histidine kinase [Owenweeksia sp.]